MCSVKIHITGQIFHLMAVSYCILSALSLGQGYSDIHKGWKVAKQ